MLHDSTGSWATAWMIVMLVAGRVWCSCWPASITAEMLPPGAKALDAPKSFGDAMKTFGHAFVTFFQKKDVVRMIAFAFLYRFGYGLLDKMGPLFMIDSRANGGLGLCNQALGGVYGTFGTRRVHRRVAARRLDRVARRASRRRCCCSACASTSRTRRSCS